MVLEKLVNYMQTFLSIMISSNWIHDQLWEPKFWNRRKHMRNISWHLGQASIFPYQIPKAQKIKLKTDKQDFIKLRELLQSKGNTKVERQ